jgi:hypothetical protein
MNKKNIKLYMMPVLLILLSLASGCKKNETIVPSEKPEYGYTLPQGNHDFDVRIMNYYKRWGSTLLYKFKDQDVSWTIVPIPSATAYKTIPADTNYINKQLDLLDNTFFKYYQDSTLKRFLPAKFFLCSSLKIGTSANARQIDAFLLQSGEVYGYYESFAVNWGRAQILNINSPIDSVSIFRGNVNYSFLKLMDVLARMKRSDVFLSISDYAAIISPTAPATVVTVADRYKRGFLANPGSVNIQPGKGVDWLIFLQYILTNSYATLTSPVTTANDATAKGILSPVKDVNGLLRRKYDAMLQHYLTQYNIDLQRIADGRP